MTGPVTLYKIDDEENYTVGIFWMVSLRQRNGVNVEIFFEDNEMCQKCNFIIMHIIYIT